jgi:hypothetical protein
MNNAQLCVKSTTPPLEDTPALLTHRTWLSTSMKGLDLDSLLKTTSRVVQNAKKANQ